LEKSDDYSQISRFNDIQEVPFDSSILIIEETTTQEDVTFELWETATLGNYTNTSKKVEKQFKKNS
jgi:hypothetical protein